MPETRDYLAEARRELEWAEEKAAQARALLAEAEAGEPGAEWAGVRVQGHVNWSRAHVERSLHLSYEIQDGEERCGLRRDIALAALARDDFLTAYAACPDDAELRDSIIARDEETMPGRVLAKAYSRLVSGPAYPCEDEDNAAKAGDE